MTTLWLKDLDIAIRRLRRSPRFLVLVLPLLALAMGGAIAMSAIVSRILVEPLPYGDSDKLVRIGHAHRERGPIFGTYSEPDFLDLKQRSRELANIAAVFHLPGQSTVNVKIGDVPEQIEAAYVSGDFFSTLSGKLHLGRMLTPRDQELGSQQVLVLSHDAWARLTGSDATIVGRTIVVSDQTFTIVGVAAPEFDYPSRSVAAWLPMANLTEDDVPRSREVRWLDVVGRIRDGGSRESAMRDVRGVVQTLSLDHPESNRGYENAYMEPLFESVIKGDRNPILIMFFATMLVLLTASVNLAGLLIVRAESKARDDAIQLALGASPLSLARQSIFEALSLATGGALLGLLLAFVALKVVRNMSLISFVRGAELSLDLRTVCFALAAMVLTGLISGLWPSLRTWRSATARNLSHRAVGSSAQGARMRAVMVVVQVALVCALGYTTGLLVQSIRQSATVELGVHSSDVISMKLQLQGVRYSKPGDIDHAREALIQAIERVPSVVAIAGSKTPPFGETGERYGIKLSGDQAEWIVPEWGFNFVSPTYFGALEVPVVNGQLFTGHEHAEQELPLVVNQEFVRRFLKTTDPISLSVQTGLGKTGRIVAVVADIHHQGPRVAPKPAVYVPLHLFERYAFAVSIGVSAHTPDILDALRRAVWSVDPSLPIGSMVWLDDHIETMNAQPRLLASTLGVFTVVSVIIVALGIYSLLYFVVTLRRREFAVRAALGATPAELVAFVLRYSAALTGIGLLCGIPLSLVAARLMDAVLFQVGHFSLSVLFFTLAGGALLAAAAALAPAISVLRIPPMEVIRYE